MKQKNMNCHYSKALALGLSNYSVLAKYSGLSTIFDKFANYAALDNALIIYSDVRCDLGKASASKFCVICRRRTKICEPSTEKDISIL